MKVTDVPLARRPSYLGAPNRPSEREISPQRMDSISASTETWVCGNPLI
jgi:hypothetical protein